MRHNSVQHLDASHVRTIVTARSYFLQIELCICKWPPWNSQGSELWRPVVLAGKGVRCLMMTSDEGTFLLNGRLSWKTTDLVHFLDWMCHFHVHVMIINHCVHTVNRLENTVRNHKFCFGQFRFFCMWNILNSEMDKFATCGHGRSMLPRMNFTTIYLEGITVIPNWHLLLLLFYSVDYCANLWQLLFD